MQRWRYYPFALLAFLLVVTSCGDQESKDDAAIRQQAKSYEEAFNRKDAKAIAALWAKDAEYVDPETGEVLSGREEIEQAFHGTFQKKKDEQMEIHVDSITLNKDQAVENGTVAIKTKEGLIRQTAYKAFYAKRDGEWLLTQVREVLFANPPSQYEHLRGLEWLVGDWVDKDEDVIIRTSFKWDRHKNFLLQDFSVTIEGKLELEGTQIIAWDPIKERIRSWVFDSDGGFGEGSWKKINDSWVVESSQTLADGRLASAINIYTQIGKDQYKWESTGREVNSVMLPNLGPVNVVKRKG